MNETGLVWKKRLWLWLPPAVLVVANLVIFGISQSGQRGRLFDLDARLAKAGEEQNRTAARAKELQKLTDRAAANRDAIAALHSDQFSTERGRLTRVIREVKELSTRAGLDPKQISYPEDKIEDYGLTRRSFVFSVEGTYVSLRRFLHFIELSPSFLTIDQIRAREARGRNQVFIDLRISTLFHSGEAKRSTADKGKT
jgi:hypothetical protein